MISAIALSAWATACDRTGIRWYLDKETLLCANGFKQLPKELPWAQIMVFAKDLPDIVEYVFPALPQAWVLDSARFVSGKRQLVFCVKGTVVLEITVLFGVEDEAEMAKISSQLSKKQQPVNRRLEGWKLINSIGTKLFGSLYTKTFGKLAKRRMQKIADKAFAKTVTLAGTSAQNKPYYCDCFTNKKASLFEKGLFRDTVILDCEPGTAGVMRLSVDNAPTAQPDGEKYSKLLALLGEPDAHAQTASAHYPAFSGYRKYLEAMYGDYENGLTDEIGCGLTVEEKAALKQHQARCFEALKFLQELSKEFHLRYYLIAGSVLGAVRHGGFIPWDDDIDIGIRVDELENFEKVVKEYLPKRLPEGFTLEQPGANNPYPRMFSKICYEGRCCIDLWPLIPTYRDGFKAKYLWYFGKIITKVHYQKIGHEVTKFQRIVKLADILFSDVRVMKMARRNERKYLNKQTPAYINLYSIYRRNKETMKREWLDEEATAMFNGLEVPVVGHTKLYLTHLYGNYMGFPLPWKRVSRHIARF